MTHLVKRIEYGPESGYNDFRHADNSLDNQPIKKMSKITETILESIDYDAIAHKRVLNYTILERQLGKKKSCLLSFDNKCVPMVYPFTSKDSDLRINLINKGIYVPKYWSRMSVEKVSLEYSLSETLIPLPIDQRYSENRN